MPLRHEADEFAVRRQAGEIGHAHNTTIEDVLHSRHLLMRNFEELIEQPEFMHQFVSGWMDGVAAKVAKKIRVFLEHDDSDTGAGEQKPEHHSGWSATNNDAACLKD
jgi:hypothetical protein